MNFDDWIETLTKPEMETIFEDGEQWRQTGMIYPEALLNVKAQEYFDINAPAKSDRFAVIVADVGLKNNILNAVTRQLYLASKATSDLEAENEKLRDLCARAQIVIELFRDVNIMGEGIHTGLRKYCQSPKARVVWEAIADNLPVWHEAVEYALDPYFTMYDGDKVVEEITEVLKPK